MAKQQFNPFVLGGATGTQTKTKPTIGGSYENPKLGITDTSAFSTGFAEGIAPGLLKLEENKALDLENQERADLLKFGEVAGGELFKGDMLNSNVNLSPQYKAALEQSQGIILNRNSTEAEKKAAEQHWQIYQQINANTQFMVDADGDEQLYSKDASNYDKLFKAQGSSYEEFMYAYNNGKVQPAVQNQNGADVGGFNIVGKDGKTKFIDMTNKININEIKSTLALKSQDKILTAGNAFAASEGNAMTYNQTTFEGSDKVTQTEMIEQDIMSRTKNADNAASLWLQSNDQYKDDTYQSILKDDSGFNGAENSPKALMIDRLKKLSSKRGSFNTKEVVEQASLLIKENPNDYKGLTSQEAILKAKKTVKEQFDIEVENLMKEYVSNEFLKKADGFFTNENGKAENQAAYEQRVAQGALGINKNTGKKYPTFDNYRRQFQEFFGTVPQESDYADGKLEKGENQFGRLGGLVDPQGNIPAYSLTPFVETWAVNKGGEGTRAFTMMELEEYYKGLVNSGVKEIDEETGAQNDTTVETLMKRAKANPSNFYYIKPGKTNMFSPIPATMFGRPNTISLADDQKINFGTTMNAIFNNLNATERQSFTDAASSMGLSNIFDLASEKPFTPKPALP